MTKLRHNCGIAVTHTLHDAYSFIKSLQHRGREACGIAAVGSSIDVVKWQGNVSKVDLVDLYKLLPAQNYKMFLAHVRYATQGREDRVVQDAHPHVIGGTTTNRADHIIIKNCDAVIVHNGQVDVKKVFGKDNGECDTKQILEEYWTSESHNLIKKIPGSFTLAIADKRRKEVIVMRDKYGLKPGVLGLKDGKYCVASEDVALKENGANIIEELRPGSIYYLSFEGDYRRRDIEVPSVKHCFFEWNYISDVNSVLNGVSVRRVREELGKEMAKEFKNRDIDIITFLPRCPEVAARAFARAIKYESRFLPLFYKLRGERSFQGTTKNERSNSIRTNLHLLPETMSMLKNKTVVLIDDSTIRGNNSKRAKELLLEAGVKKIYLLNYTPKIGIIGKDKIGRGCLFGVDMPPNDDFIVRASDKKRNRSDSEISKELGMDTFFLSSEGLFRVFERLGIPRKNLCSYCIGGDFPFK
jgi:amidophosphoribosyltransferase